ncbi:MAG: Pycsar system effector family protein [Saprospiraceae bacterium]
MSTKTNKVSKASARPQKRHDSHAEDMVDHYWGSLTHVQSLIKASELKAGLILSFYGILLNFVYQSYSSLSANDETSYILLGLLGVWFLSTAASIYFCFRCFIPRIEGAYDDNVFFFNDVISKFGGIKEFSKTFYKVSMNEQELFGQMGEQIFIVSKIAAWKFRNVQRAIRLLAVGMMILLVAIAVTVFLR